MTSVNYNIRIEKELRDEAFAVLDSYGLPPSQAFRLFLKQIAGTGVVPLSFDYAPKPIDYEKNPDTMQAIADARSGNMSRYQNVDELMTAIEHSNPNSESEPS